MNAIWLLIIQAIKLFIQAIKLIIQAIRLISLKSANNVRRPKRSKINLLIHPILSLPLQPTKPKPINLRDPIIINSKRRLSIQNLKQSTKTTHLRRFNKLFKIRE